MTWKTPSSLKWLIVRRMRLSGMLEKLAPKHAELKEQFESIDARVNKLRQQLSALDQTFQLHEIQIDPSGLRSVVPHENQRLVPHGQMSRQIRQILANHEGWASTAEITLKIIQQLKAAVDDETYMYVHIAVRRRLRGMLSEGQVHRIQGIPKGRCYDGSNQSMWRLSGAISRASAAN
jgi:hypothetical protein